MDDLEALGANEACSVCGDDADGYHYGVRSCRGCNAFFRRAITYNMQFTCRRGGNCPVDKNARCACRACRLKKCEEVGMDRRAVQPKRDSNGMYSNRKREMCDGTVPSSSSPQMGEHTIISPGSAFTPINNGYNSELCLPPLPVSPPPTAGLISRQCYEFIEQKKRRHAMLCTTLEEILCDNQNPTLRGVASSDDLSNIFKAQIVLMFEWASRQPDFMKIKPKDRVRMLRLHVFEYILLDDVYRTLESGYTDRFVLVNNTYMAPGQYNNESTSKQVSNDVVVAMGSDWLNHLNADIIVPLTQMRVNLAEILTLRLYSFWDVAEKLAYDESKAIANTALTTVASEFIQYNVTEHNTTIDEAKCRLEKVISLLPKITEHMKMLYRIATFIPDFGILNDWERHMNDAIFRM